MTKLVNYAINTVKPFNTYSNLTTLETRTQVTHALEFVSDIGVSWCGKHIVAAKLLVVTTRGMKLVKWSFEQSLSTPREY